MSSKKIFQIQDVRNKSHISSDKASEARIILDKALMTWSLAWESYTILEKKTDSDFYAIANAYEKLILTWRAYKKSIPQNSQVYVLDFSSTSNPTSYVSVK